LTVRDSAAPLSLENHAFSLLVHETALANKPMTSRTFQASRMLPRKWMRKNRRKFKQICPGYASGYASGVETWRKNGYYGVLNLYEIPLKGA
jgi:hypothetical protein